MSEFGRWMPSIRDFVYTIKQSKSLESMYMNKNERITIKALQNGYLVERSWREAMKPDGDVFDYRHMDEEFMFKTWDEVVEFVTQNKLDVPPAKI